MAADAQGERPSRSLAKAASYRIGAIVLDLVGAYVITAKLDVAIGFTIAVNLCALLGYFAHERIWARIEWGTRHARAKRDALRVG